VSTVTVLSHKSDGTVELEVIQWCEIPRGLSAHEHTCTVKHKPTHCQVVAWNRLPCGELLTS